MTTEEFLDQTLGQCIMNAGLIQDRIDVTVHQLSALRQLMAVATAAQRPGRKRAPHRKRRQVAVPSASNGNGNDET